MIAFPLMQFPSTPTTENLMEQVPEAPFYIPATGTSTRPRRTLKHNDTFAVLDSHGDLGASAGGPDGIFHEDTRYLFRLELLLNGEQPLLLGSNLRDDNATLTIDLTNPDLYPDEDLHIKKDKLHIVRTIFLWNSALYQRIGLRNHGDTTLDLHLSLTFGSDFSDLFEVRGMKREKRGNMEVMTRGDSVNIIYTGLDHISRRTQILFDPKPEHLTTSNAQYGLSLLPGEARSIFVIVRCNPPASPAPNFLAAFRGAQRDIRREVRGLASIETSNEVFNEVLCHAFADLRMLMTQTAEGIYPYAGIPWYSTTFGRDGIITAIEMLWLEPDVARGVLMRLAAHQAQGVDEEADAEPGKILHEMRGGEMAALGEIPFKHYYGSVDSTPLFVLLAGLYFERTGDLETLRCLWPSVLRALRWIDEFGDRDGDGFVEYHRANHDGLINQGWKDSHDSVFHADGRLAQPPIALAEVQGYVFAAKKSASRCAERLGETAIAARLEDEAERLRENFERKFWCEELGTYALALDRDKNPCRVRTSNPGHLLFACIADPARAEIVSGGLLKPDFLSGWGVRTVAQGEARYNPMSYHNGSVWPHDNALIAMGFARYGLNRQIEPIFTGLFDAASYMDLRRLPELFCGFRRGKGRGPTLYPVACSPQAWASAAPLLLLQASLGLEIHAEQNEIRMRTPCLPRFLDRVLVRGLKVGEASVDLLVFRQGNGVGVQIVRGTGTVRLVVIPAGG